MVKIFISYAHEDETYKDLVVKHLSLYTRKGMIQIWTDRDILPGIEWDDEIKRKIDEVQIFLLLVSSDFINSDYIHKVEIERALDRYAKKEVLIIPIIIRPCDFASTELSKFQAVPTDGIPISKWENKDDAWLNVTNQLKKVFLKVESDSQILTKPKPETKNVEQISDTSIEESKLELGQLILKPNLDKAFDLLMETTKMSNDRDLYNTALLLTSRYNKLKNDELHGIISTGDAEVSRARIKHAFISLVDDL